ncbi:hypothetical protein ACSBOB_25870 [Mesorhizobium sp. ASY16-5R]|uniref:hypothetical protein n=1 Tax=Mesorhizobium sp. ASY16-5R TaxID=3445772 RepID=UPI003FA04C8B
MGLRFDPPAEQRPLPALPQPEDIFLSWLVALPDAIDPGLAADAEILRLAKYSASHPGPAHLLTLFKTFRASLKPVSRHPRVQ